MDNPEQSPSPQEPSLEEMKKIVKEKDKKAPPEYKEEPESELEKSWKEFDAVVENLLNLIEGSVKSEEFSGKKLSKELSVELGEKGYVNIPAGKDISQSLVNFFRDTESTIGKSIDDINLMTDSNEKIAKLSECKSHYNELLTTTKELLKKISEALEKEKEGPI